MPVLAMTRWAGVGQARDLYDVATAGAAETRQRVMVAAAEAYLAVIAARRQVDVSERAIDSARAHLDYATRRLKAAPAAGEPIACGAGGLVGRGAARGGQLAMRSRRKRSGSFSRRWAHRRQVRIRHSI
jgi:hypothetical protein